MATVDASIPLGVQLPQMMSPAQAMGQVATLRQLQANTMLKNMEVQQGLQSLKDQQELSALMADPSNLDPATGGLKPEALNNITNPALRQKLNKERMETLYKAKEIEYKGSEAGKVTEDRQQKALHDVWESAFGKYEDILKKTGNEKLALDAFNKAQADGYEDLKTTGRGGFQKDYQFKILSPQDVMSRITTHKERAEEDARGETTFIKETNYLKKLESQLMGLSPTDPQAVAIRKQIGEVKAHIAKLDAPSRTQINMAGGAPTLQGDALDFAANQLLVDGKMPAGFARNSANVGAIYKRAAELAKSKGMSSEEALFNSKSIKADQSSLGNLTKQYDMITSFESTALKNLDMLVNQSKKVPRGSIPLINKALMTGKLETGDPETAKYYAIVKPFVDEYAKILSGQTGSAGASDTARREAASILSPYFSQDQIDQLGPFIKQELKNRTSSMEEQRETIKSRMKSGGKSEKSSSSNKDDGKPPLPPLPTPGSSIPAGWSVQVK